MSGPREFTVGDRVCVHGQGFGRIADVVERSRADGGSYALVQIWRESYHKPSRRKIEWQDSVIVDLDVYPAHMSRSAA